MTSLTRCFLTLPVSYPSFLGYLYTVHIVTVLQGWRVAKLEREVQELRNMVGRSRSPRMQPRQKALAARAPCPTGSSRGEKGAKKGTGKGGKNKSSSTQVGSSSGSNSGRADFDQIVAMGSKAWALFHPSHKDKSVCSVCFNFQKHQCSDPKASNMMHVCIRCVAERRPYNDCFCLQSKLY